MTIYAQDGFGRTDKIERGIQDGSIAGVVLSPRDERNRTLLTTLSRLYNLYPEIAILVDPQFHAITHAATITNHRLRHLAGYPYFDQGLSFSVLSNSSTVQSFIKLTLDHQVALPVNRLISPTVLIEDFSNNSSKTALQMANQSITYHASLKHTQPLLISLVISETALVSEKDVEKYLDALSLLEGHGFYIIVNRSTQQYSSAFDSTQLRNLLYLVYVLAEVNQFEIICGFSDFVGLLLHAVGAKATASGWFSNLRQFTMDRFMPKKGGSPARPRYSSLPLLNSILIGELDNIQRVGQLPSVLSGSIYDRIFTASRSPSKTPWPSDISYLHHWAVLNQLIAPVKQGDLKQRLNYCSAILKRAQDTYDSLRQIGVGFETASGNRHIRQWSEALESFRSRIRV